MKKNSRSKERGKQYDHESFMHGDKGTMRHGGLEHHEEGDHYKRPDEHSHDNSFPQFGA